MEEQAFEILCGEVDCCVEDQSAAMLGGELDTWCGGP